MVSLRKFSNGHLLIPQKHCTHSPWWSFLTLFRLKGFASVTHFCFLFTLKWFHKFSKKKVNNQLQLQGSSSNLLFPLYQSWKTFFFSWEKSTVHGFAYEILTFSSDPWNSEMEALTSYFCQPHHFIAGEYRTHWVDNHALLSIWY